MKTQTYKNIGENQAKASGLALSISTKHSIEICNLIRHKKLNKAKQILEEVIKLKTPVPFRRFTGDVGHKKGPLAAGRYPVKASGNILTILKSAEANAVTKGLNPDDLKIISIIPNRGAGDLRYGRRRGRSAKRTHIQIILEEKVKKKEMSEKQSFSEHDHESKIHDKAKTRKAKEKQLKKEKPEEKKQEKQKQVEKPKVQKPGVKND